MTAIVPGRDRLAFLDAMRGIAACLVLVQHIAEYVLVNASAPAPALTVLRAVFVDGVNVGRLGVVLFFLISGYVIPFSFREPAPLRNFAVSRVLRLYPAYWLSIAVSLLALAATDQPMPPSAAILANLTMVQRYLGQPDLVTVYWTLAVELAFYALCAMLFAIGRLRSTATLTGCVAALSALALLAAGVAAATGRHMPAGLPQNLALMCTGALARRGWLDGEPGARRATWAAVALLLLLVAPAVEFTVVKPPDADLTFYPSAFIAGVAIAVIVFMVTIRIRPAMGRALIWLGGVSYSVYLFHPAMLRLAHPLLAIGGGLAFAIVGVIMTLLVSWLAYRFVERPSIALGKRLRGGAAGRAGARAQEPAR